MIKCKSCGNEIAETAKTCPKCGAKNSKPWYKRWWLWVIAVFLVIGIASGSGNNQDNVANPVDTNPVSANTVSQSNAIDDKVCEIVSAEIGGVNYEGKPTVVITYQYTNNSTEAASFDLSFSHAVYQNGIECNHNYVYEVDEPNGEKDIRPGATIEVKKSYILNDTTSDVEVEISGLISWDESVITKTFSIAS